MINLTAGMGGDLVLGGADAPLPLDADGTDLVGAEERLAHVAELRPEICTLDCGSMNFAAGGDYVMINTPGMLRAMAAHVQALGVRPELEVFDFGPPGHGQGPDARGPDRRPGADPALHGHPLRRAERPGDADGARARGCPRGRCSSAFSIGRMQLPYVALAVLAGGNVRVGLEDNLYLSRGVLATNAELVERAVTILEAMNVRVLGPDEVRERLGLDARMIERAGLLGGGVIGGGWAARLLLAGVDVALYDPAPGAERVVGEVARRTRAGRCGG